MMSKVLILPGSLKGEAQRVFLVERVIRSMHNNSKLRQQDH